MRHAEATPAKPCHIMRTVRCFASEVQEGKVDTRGRCDMQRFLAWPSRSTSFRQAGFSRGTFVARPGSDILAAGSAVTLPLVCHMMHWLKLMTGA